MSAPPAAAPQPAVFAFDVQNLARARTIIAKYPPGRQASAVLPLLDMAQRQSGNWLPRAAMDYVAGLLDMAPIRVYEVATFYSMFNLSPVGTWFFQICTTTPAGCAAPTRSSKPASASSASMSARPPPTAGSRSRRSNVSAPA